MYLFHKVHVVLIFRYLSSTNATGTSYTNSFFQNLEWTYVIAWDTLNEIMETKRSTLLQDGEMMYFATRWSFPSVLWWIHAKNNNMTWMYMCSNNWVKSLLHWPIDPFPKSHNAWGKYPTMHHFVMGNFVTKWCIVGYRPGALWDLCKMSWYIICLLQLHIHCSIAHQFLLLHNIVHWVFLTCWIPAMIFISWLNHFMDILCDMNTVKICLSNKHVFCWSDTWFYMYIYIVYFPKSKIFVMTLSNH